jgi:4a-hydroxytetrahydrobiopterin dehydratase
MAKRDKLSDAAIAEKLKALPKWTCSAGKLHRELRFPDFQAAFGFMTACALAAESLNHHPEWFNVWATVKIDLNTHDVQGITELDFTLAEKMESLAARWGA